MLRSALRARHLLVTRVPIVRALNRLPIQKPSPSHYARRYTHTWGSENIHYGSFPERTHSCGALNKKETGKLVTLCGWVPAVRSISNDLLFIPLRDAYGTTQLVFRSEACSNAEAANALRSKINSLTPESVVCIQGVVRERPEGMRNKDLASGDIEVELQEVMCLNTAATNLPFLPGKQKLPKEEVRMKHRYLDLRRPELQQNIRLRSKVASIIRNYLSEHQFVEVETPVLFKSTPEGAREYVVPTRNHGQFYALPQSPQQHKQMLMAAGIDRYYQIARCFRDEDLRADRQPEFTQIDLEMSFIKASDIQNIIEGMVTEIWKNALDIQLDKSRFPHITYQHAMSKYGSDKPDVRFGMHIHDISKHLPGASEDGVLECMVVKKGANLKTAEIRSVAQEYESQNGDLSKLNSVKVNENNIGSWLEKCSLSKRSSDVKTAQNSLNSQLEIEQGDLVYIHKRSKYLYGGNTPLGKVRLQMSKLLQDASLLHIDPSDYKFLWVESFPLFTPDEAGLRTWQATHHPFTAPFPEDLALLESDPSKVRGQHYDLVLNGMEIGGGSIRIHYPEMQRFIFDKVLELQPHEYQRFDHLLEALAGGCPPHGGIALGFDRLMSIICGTPSIRDVIAFPKAGGGKDLVVNSPSELTPAQLAEYGLQLTKK
ncbi:tRNA synthetases class II-domain-containing protein [Umbelopsis sp. AD052]|nr:tRNA synthetases class II-domain-containing protein [Umbelopsis sp. AD052]